MRKCIALVILVSCILGLVGCTAIGTETDYPAAIMVNEGIYLLTSDPMPAEVDESAIIGYTTSYTDTFPKKDGETNFNRELEMPYAEVEDGIAVLYNDEWYLCIPEVFNRTGT